METAVDRNSTGQVGSTAHHEEERNTVRQRDTKRYQERDKEEEIGQQRQQILMYLREQERHGRVAGRRRGGCTNYVDIDNEQCCGTSNRAE